MPFVETTLLASGFFRKRSNQAMMALALAADWLGRDAMPCVERGAPHQRFGILTSKVVPWSAPDDTVMVPPCAPTPD